MDAQKLAWGLTVDREFGGCRCADEDEMEFQPNKNMYEDNTWACRCLNEDLYPSQADWQVTCSLVELSVTDRGVSFELGTTTETPLK